MHEGAGVADEFIRITGGRKLAELGAAVRSIGEDRTIIKQLQVKVRKLFAPVRKEIKASAVAILPKTGGLGEWAASSRTSLAVRRGVNTAGMSVRVGRNSKGGRSDIRRLDDAGRIRHPLWGNRKHWYPQTVESGFVSKPIHGPITDAFVREVIAATDAAIEEALRGH